MERTRALIATGVLIIALPGCSVGLGAPTAGQSSGQASAAPAGTAPGSSASTAPSPTSAASSGTSSGTASGSSSAEPVPSLSATVLPPPPKASTGVLRVTSSTLRGRSGRLSWTVRIPVFSGTARAGTINYHLRASAGDAIAQAKKAAASYPEDKTTLDGTYTLSTNDGRTAQAALTFSSYVQGAAHPSDSVGTTAIDARTGRPILLTDVFTSESAALRKLGPLVRKIAAAKGEDVTESSGLAPKHSNWANWQTTGAGISFYFQDYQLGGHGLRFYTVGWDSVDNLLTDYARRTLAPPR